MDGDPGERAEQTVKPRSHDVLEKRNITKGRKREAD
jgi:hypothetical protein